MLIAQVLFFLIFATVAYAGYSAAPWVPMRARDVERMMEAGSVKPGERIADLGCGDGRMVIAGCRRGATGVGFEISLPLVVVSWVRFRFSRLPARVSVQNFWKTDLTSFDVLFGFLTPTAHAKIPSWSASHLRPGSRLVVFAWPIPGWTAESIHEEKGYCPIFVYRIH